MRSDLMVERLEHELPAYGVTVRVTQCENRFEVIAKPGAEIDAWKLQALLANWIQSRMDSHKSGGHNSANFTSEACDG